MLSLSELPARPVNALVDAPTPSPPAVAVAVAIALRRPAVAAAAALPPAGKEVGDGGLHASVVPARQFAPSQKVKGTAHFHSHK